MRRDLKERRKLSREQRERSVIVPGQGEVECLKRNKVEELGVTQRAWPYLVREVGGAVEEGKVNSNTWPRILQNTVLYFS